jgi:hypothetical protein
MLKELGMGNETRLLFHFTHVISPRISQNNIYYTPAPRRGRGVYCFTSVRPSKIFFVTFFSATIDRFLPSIVAEKNATKNEHICSMCIKINKVGKQESDGFKNVSHDMGYLYEACDQISDLCHQ